MGSTQGVGFAFSRMRGLTLHSTGPSTAGRLGPGAGTRYIFYSRAKPSHRSGPVSSTLGLAKYPAQGPRAASTPCERDFGRHAVSRYLSLVASGASRCFFYQPVDGASRRLNSQNVGAAGYSRQFGITARSDHKFGVLTFMRVLLSVSASPSQILGFRMPVSAHARQSNQRLVLVGGGSPGSPFGVYAGRRFCLLPHARPNPAFKRTHNGGHASGFFQHSQRRCGPLTSTLGSAGQAVQYSSRISACRRGLTSHEAAKPRTTNQSEAATLSATDRRMLMNRAAQLRLYP